MWPDRECQQANRPLAVSDEEILSPSSLPSCLPASLPPTLRTLPTKLSKAAWEEAREEPSFMVVCSGMGVEREGMRVGREAVLVV